MMFENTEFFLNMPYFGIVTNSLHVLNCIIFVFDCVVITDTDHYKTSVRLTFT